MLEGENNDLLNLRVLILSANVGEGHASASRALARRLERSPGVSVEIEDGLRGMGRLAHHVIERGFDFQLRAAPWLYSLTYALLMRFAPARWFAQKLLYLIGARPLTRMIAAHRPDVVISTYPATTVVLGRLRLRRVIKGPVYAAITDLTGLFFWAHPGIDMHFVVYAESTETVERIAGPDSAVHVAPLVDEAFFSPCTRSDARERLNLPPVGRVVVVSGGGWGVGDLHGAARAALEFDDTTVVVVTGHNERVKDELEREFAHQTSVRVLGFTDQMRDLLVAADVLVHSTGGVTVIEAALCGCPSISYGLPVGHVLHNTRAMAEIGVTGLAESPRALALELARHLGGVPVSPPRWDIAADVGEHVVGRQSRVKPPPAWRIA
ncbi:MAG: glycosyltransferase, partial [Thermoleophilia bacterium]|nr:glycosyltransferase [Thermoleophilia bacterium]